MSGKPATAPKDAAKALKAAKSARVGTTKKKTAVRTKTHFYRPKTRTGGHHLPRYIKSLPLARGTADKHHKVVRKPLTTEAAMKKIEDNNTIVFLCDPKANKLQIRAAIFSLYDVKAAKINTLIRPDGVKKAYVKLTADYDALEVANRIGVLA